MTSDCEIGCCSELIGPKNTLPPACEAAVKIDYPPFLHSTMFAVLMNKHDNLCSRDQVRGENRSVLTNQACSWVNDTKVQFLFLLIMLQWG